MPLVAGSINSPAPAGLVHLALALLLSGCASIQTPDQVAKTFWEAMAKRDIQSARGYCTNSTRDSLTSPDEQVANAIPGFGEMRIKGDDASIDTTLQFPGDKSRPSISLETYLKKEQGAWKIDYDATMASRSDAGPLTKMMEDLQKFTDALSENLEGAISNFEKDLPQIEEKAKSMAERLKEQLDEFSRMIEETFKKRQERKPKPPEQHTI